MEQDTATLWSRLLAAVPRAWIPVVRATHWLCYVRGTGTPTSTCQWVIKDPRHLLPHVPSSGRARAGLGRMEATGFYASLALCDRVAAATAALPSVHWTVVSLSKTE